VKRLTLALLAASLAAGESVPDWVSEAARQTVATYPPKVNTVELLREESVTVQSDGRIESRERHVVRVIQRGRNSLDAVVEYNPKGGKVRELQGWMLPPSGKTINLGKNQVADVSLATSYEYDEERARVLAAGNLEPGAIFAWEAVSEEKTIFAQYDYSFQHAEPVLVSRFSISLPAGWEARGTVLNHPVFQPAMAGNSYTWELRDLPWLEAEEHSPSIAGLAPRLGVNYFPSDNSRADLRPVKDWSAQSALEAGFFDPSAEVSDAVRNKARELTARAATETDKIRAIANFVQKTNYVAVEIKLARGGGLIPHKADEVLARNYGDCKDKATLMRALLRAVNIDSWIVSIYSGSREHVHPEWTASQFNHAIIAVRVSPDTKLPTVLETPRLGRLLIFDPTSRVTPLGDLPEDEQGSYALVVAGSQGELLTMPLLPPELNRVESEAEAQLNPDGTLSAHIQRHYFGEPATRLRYTATLEQHDELKHTFEEALSYRLGGLELKKIEPSDRMQDDQFLVNMDVSVKQFGTTLQGRLLMVSPGTLGRRSGYSFPAKPRAFPVKLRAEALRDSVTLNVPATFKVDELPDPVKLTSAYGAYSAQWKADGNRIHFEQSLEVKDTLAPAAEYAKIRQFFDKVDTAQNSSVVLVKE